jgi:hypothetical protein
MPDTPDAKSCKLATSFASRPERGLWFSKRTRLYPFLTGHSNCQRSACQHSTKWSPTHVVSSVVRIGPRPFHGWPCHPHPPIIITQESRSEPTHLVRFGFGLGWNSWNLVRDCSPGQTMGSPERTGEKPQSPCNHGFPLRSPPITPQRIRRGPGTDVVSCWICAAFPRDGNQDLRPRHSQKRSPRRLRELSRRDGDSVGLGSCALGRGRVRDCLGSQI